MRITFVRHGETSHNKEGRITGEIDVSLNEEGVAQAEKLAQMLPTDYDVLYTSTLKRAQETADIINAKLSLPVIVSPLIVERRFGSLVGKTWDELDTYIPERRRLDKEQKYDYRPFGGESAEEVKMRLLAFVEEVKQRFIYHATCGNEWRYSSYATLSACQRGGAYP